MSLSLMAHIAYVSADLGVPIFGTKGCSIHAQEILGAMVRQGAVVDLFSTSLEGTPPVGLETLRLHPLPRPPKGDPAQREQGALANNEILTARLNAQASCDFIYERYSLWSYAAMETAKQLGRPGLLEVNAPLIDEQAQYRVLVDRAAAMQVAERAFAAASAVLAVSDEVAAWVESFPAAKGKIHVVPNGIRPERFPAGLAPLQPGPPGIFTVGFVGTLKAWHGLSVLVDAFAQLHGRDPNTRLIIVGDGPEREKILAQLTALGLAKAVVMTGAVAASEVPGWLASMDVAVAPYPPLEHFYFSPLKVYEYMAAGLALVASDLGQLRKLIRSSVNGLLVTPGDAEGLAAALSDLKENPAKRAALGREARATVLSNLTWDQVVSRIFQLAQCELAPPQRV